MSFPYRMLLFRRLGNHPCICSQMTHPCCCKLRSRDSFPLPYHCTHQNLTSEKVKEYTEAQPYYLLQFCKIDVVCPQTLLLFCVHARSLTSSYFLFLPSLSADVPLEVNRRHLRAGYFSRVLKRSYLKIKSVKTYRYSPSLFKCELYYPDVWKSISFSRHHNLP